MPLDVAANIADHKTLRIAVEQVGAGVLVTDRQGKVVLANPAVLEMTGYSAAELIGRPKQILHSHTHEDSHDQELWNTVLGGGKWEGEIVHRRKDGSRLLVSASISPVLDESGKIERFIEVYVDITEKTRLQEILRQRDKLESLGALASGVAHDFRNILAAIVNHADLARNRLVRDREEASRETVANCLDLILSTAHQAGDLVQRLLDFSSPAKSLTPAPVSVQREVQAVTRILGPGLASSIKLLTHLEDADCWVNAYPLAIQQVLLNLGLNAADAISDQPGFIRIESFATEISDDRPAPFGTSLAPGRYLNLRIIDNGPGIPEAVRDRVFEPFFSTKRRSDRNGLGLAMVARLVTELQGHISFESVLGVGTRFEILLPITDAPEAPVTVPPPEHAPAVFEQERDPGPSSERRASLLFLEDDPAISQGARLILESCGFTVEHCASGKDGLRLITSRVQPFDVVVSDFHLPDMNAVELIQRSIKHCDKQRFVLVSGSMLSEDILGGMRSHVDRIYSKPISYFTVARELHELLGTGTFG